MTEAFLVVFEHRKTKAIMTAGIYSEPQPTCAVEWESVVLFTRRADTFEQARDEIRFILRRGLQQGLATSDIKRGRH